MNRKDKVLIGALVPKAYGRELFDKLNGMARRRNVLPMTYLVRTLLGMWFDGRIEISSEDIEAYELDHRRTNRYGNQVLDVAHKAGKDAASNGMPLTSNPYDPESKSFITWNDGWKSYFSEILI